jgi:ABC-type transport system involved in Fe-S cluster assembly fused permease/ATPase subunit
MTKKRKNSRDVDRGSRGVNFIGLTLLSSFVFLVAIFLATFFVVTWTAVFYTYIAVLLVNVTLFSAQALCYLDNARCRVKRDGDRLANGKVQR